MFSQKDEKQIRDHGSSLAAVQHQIDNYRKGFPFLEIEEAATPGNGIIIPDNQSVEENIMRYDQKLAEGLKPIKFVPASGAASRMFKALFEAYEGCLKSDNQEEALAGNPAARKFLVNKEKFAFYSDLNEFIESHNVTKSCLNWIDFLLNSRGLNYGSLPKGLLKFHKYPGGARTAFEEHLVESAGFAADNRAIARLHFTVSPDHLNLFKDLFNNIKYPFLVYK